MLLLVWFGGPYIAVGGNKILTSVLARLAVMLFIIIIWLILVLVLAFTKKKSDGNDKVVAGMVDADKKAEKKSDESVRKEMNTLQRRMIQAHQILKESRFNETQNIYELPWYIFVGPPGTGKTTAIQNSGLEYPLKEKMGVSMVKGVGGTRNCDWWFTDKAILIDTAGRYVTQDSHVDRDGRSWLGFLNLLKRWRPLRPINGVIISMGISDLLTDTESEVGLHGRAIKNRLQELQNQLGMIFPVYVLLSKCDLIVGFKEFFDELDKDECEQVWGITFSLTHKYETVVDGFNEEFHNLINNVNARVNRRLLSERNQEKKRVIYEFPKQLRMLQRKIDGFLKQIFSSNAYETEPMLRGVYLTSAIQKGQAIDQLSPSLLTSARLQLVYNGQRSGHSYFIQKVLEDVVFPEKNLATTNRYYDKQYSILRNTSLIGLLLLLFLCSTAWWNSFNWNKKLTAKTELAIASYQQVTKDSSTLSNNLIQLNNALTILRDMPIGYNNDPSQNKIFRWGLYQSNDLKSASVDAYKNALHGYLQPYLTSILLNGMVTNSNNLGYLYLTLRTYLMLYQPKHFIRADVLAWFRVYFERNLIGEVNDVVRKELIGHLNALLDMGLRNSPINDTQVLRFQTKLSLLSMSERAYQRLKFTFIPSNIPDFLITDSVNLKTLQAFKFLNKSAQNVSIPGLYTYDGFYKIFLKHEKEIVDDVIKDGWVYGDQIKRFDAVTKKRILKNFESKYFKDYIFYWNNFIDNITLVDFGTNKQVSLNLDLLTSSNSPMKHIIEAVQKNVNITKLPPESGKGKFKKLLDAKTKLASKEKQLNDLLPAKVVAILKSSPGKQVNHYFNDIIKFDNKTIAPANGTLVNLNKQIKEHISVESGGFDDIPQTAAEKAAKDKLPPIKYLEVANNLGRQIVDMPEPLYSWYRSIIDWLIYQDAHTNALAKVKFRTELNNKWKNQIAYVCNSTIAGRYPLARSNTDITLANFSSFFAYGGILDAFFNTNLANYVDTTKSTWTSKNGLIIDPAVLSMIQQAGKIREAYFQPGIKGPHVPFVLRPVFLDKDINFYKFTLNGQSFSYRHDPIRNINFLWPGRKLPNSTIISFTPVDGRRVIKKQYYGDWAFFHFLDDVQKTSPSVSTNGLLEIEEKGAKAKMFLVPGSKINPFWNQSLRRFTCPANL